MFYFYFRSYFVTFLFFKLNVVLFFNVVIAQLYSNAFANFFKNGQIYVEKIATSNSNVVVCPACCSNNLLHFVVCKLILLFVVDYPFSLLK